MKLKNIINTLTVAAVALIATACNDTDAQYSIPDIDAPQYVSAALSADQPVYFGETTIQVTFDQNVNFATRNTSQITVNGGAADKALHDIISRNSAAVCHEFGISCNSLYSGFLYAGFLLPSLLISYNRSGSIAIDSALTLMHE